MAKKVTQIVEEQVRVWRRRSHIGKPSSAKSDAYPVITVSREFGAKGAALARMLGEKLGFKVWDKEILLAIAEELGSGKKFLETLDERRQQAVENTVAGFIKNIHTNENYFRSLLRVVRTIEEHGNSIIVGRGANYICKNPSSFHVRVVCPLQTRIKEFAKREKIDIPEARLIIEQKDLERAEFIQENFDKDVSTPSDYDLIINSKTFTLEQMEVIIRSAYELQIGKEIKVVA